VTSKSPSLVAALLYLARFPRYVRAAAVDDKVERIAERDERVDEQRRYLARLNVN